MKSLATSKTKPTVTAIWPIQTTKTVRPGAGAALARSPPAARPVAAAV